jgi:hypothetical protein
MTKLEIKAVLDYLKGMFSDPSANVKPILEDGDWPPDTEFSESLFKETQNIIADVFDAATNRIEEIRRKS